MGSVSVFFGFFLIKLISVPILKLLSIKIAMIRKGYRKLRRNIFFRDIHRIFIETYIEFLIAFYFNYKHPLYTEVGDIMGVVFGFMACFGTMIFIPVSFFYILVCKNGLRILKKPIFESKWGALYEGVSIKSKLHVMFYFFYVIRRLIFVSLAFNWDHVAFQMIPIMLINMFFVIY